MSLEHLTYVKTLFEALLFVILVPLILFELFRNPKTAGRRALEHGTSVP